MTPTEFSGWHKATASEPRGSCVEVGYAPGRRGIRDTTLGQASPVAEGSERAFRRLLDAMKSDRLG